MLCFKEVIDQLAVANSVPLYGHVSMREDGHVLLGPLEFKIKSQMMKGRLNRTLKKRVEVESMKVGLIREHALCLSMWILALNQVATR